MLEVQVSEEGDKTCSECFSLGNQQRFIMKVTKLVLYMDQAEYLHHMMFKQELVDDLRENLRKSSNYLRRHKKNYETFFAYPVEELHKLVRSQWSGKMGQIEYVTEAMTLWRALIVKPAVDTEPGHCLKDKALKDLLLYMGRDPTTTGSEMDLVAAVVSGDLSRHPCFQGILVACMTKLRGQDQGRQTMRNPHRPWTAHGVA